MFTGKKFNCNKGAYYRFRGLSDELCAKYDLTVIKIPKGRTPRNIYFAEKRGEPTKYNLMRQAIDDALKMSISVEQFKKVLYKKGYIINNASNRKYSTIRSIHDKKATRLYQLGENYSLQKIIETVNNNPYSYQNRYYDYIKPKSKFKQHKKYRYKGSCENISKKATINVLFILLFYFMGLIPKEKPKHKPLSSEMKSEIRKMECFARQIRLISKEKLETVDDVKEYISKINDNIEKTIDIRQKYRNKLRNCKYEENIKDLKGKISSYSSILKEYRTNIKLAKQIIEDIPKIKDVIQIEKRTIIEHRELEQNRNKKREKWGR